MACRLDRAIAAALWPALLQSAERLREIKTDHARLNFVHRQGQWECVDAPGAGDHTMAVEAKSDGPLQLGWHGIDATTAPWMSLYMPLLFGAWRARNAGRAFVTAHVAQTLDGRIACDNGHSQWISNEANLLHAHRLRALHDGVLVGSNTVLADDPQLNTRLVPGPNPSRIVLSGSGGLAEAPSSRHVFAPPGATVLCREDQVQRFGAPHHESLDIVPLNAEDGGHIAPATTLRALAARGVHSVFLEGGSATLSSFLAAGSIDILHVHVAPMILGSGVSSFALSPITNVRDSLKLTQEHFDLEGEILLACRRAPE